METIQVDTLTCSFKAGWKVAKYDAWNFYRKKFQGIRVNVKAVDLFVLSPEKCLFLIEVKDYRRHVRTKPSELSAEVSCKVFDSLAALLPARLNATDMSERRFASLALAATNLKVVLHLEQPAQPSKLFPVAIDPSNVQMQLRQVLKCIDAHPKVPGRNRPHPLWSVA
jgi:hypothetical protein